MENIKQFLLRKNEDKDLYDQIKKEYKTEEYGCYIDFVAHSNGTYTDFEMHHHLFYEKHKKEIWKIIDKNGGFLSEDELPGIIAINRLEPLLIRHSHGRMVCSAQDVAFHVKLIDDHDEAYVRDVSWPATRR